MGDWACFSGKFFKSIDLKWRKKEKDIKVIRDIELLGICTLLCSTSQLASLLLELACHSELSLICVTVLLTYIVILVSFSAQHRNGYMSINSCSELAHCVASNIFCAESLNTLGLIKSEVTLTCTVGSDPVVL